ncbi:MULTISPECIES: hypothetical protein [unclassified Sphingobacterium]|uniref:hypothetical protein n=1 Tax=unclassified Sphingobacterium TaxID=2609468 RepID=UPI0020C53681|nr:MULTISPECIES: hypothetical protein [unclassified Sphingobacterium]
MEIQDESVVIAEDLLYKMGFQFSPSSKLGEYDSFDFIKNSKNDVSYMGISKKVFEDYNISTTFFTLYRTDYNLIKQELTSLGFKHTETESVDSTTTHYYKKGDTIIELSYNYYEQAEIFQYFINITSESGFRYYML